MISTDSVLIDRVVKRVEYAAAGIPRYWFVDRDPHTTVHMHRLVSGDYEDHGTVPLDRLLAGPVVDLT